MSIDTQAVRSRVPRFNFSVQKKKKKKRKTTDLNQQGVNAYQCH